MKNVNFEIGQSFLNSAGEKATIVSFIKGTKTTSRKANIQFEDGTIVTVNTPKLNTGVFKNPNKPCVCGVGFIGEGKYYSSKGKVPTKSYVVWNSMLERCYSGRYPSYQDVEVCREWHNYQNFAKWYHEQAFDRAGKYQLDKDLLGNSKIYSPETCCLLKDNINQLLSTEGYGYTYRDGSWLVNSLSKYVTVSSELTAKDIVLSYRINKLYEIIHCVGRQTLSDGRIIPALWLKVIKLQDEQLSVRETMGLNK